MTVELLANSWTERSSVSTAHERQPLIEEAYSRLACSFEESPSAQNRHEIPFELLPRERVSVMDTAVVDLERFATELDQTHPDVKLLYPSKKGGIKGADSLPDDVKTKLEQAFKQITDSDFAATAIVPYPDGMQPKCGSAEGEKIVFPPAKAKISIQNGTVLIRHGHGDWEDMGELWRKVKGGSVVQS